MKKKVIIIIIAIILVLFMGIFLYVNINKRIAVLCYHNIATEEEKQNFPDEADWIITVENFEEHLRYFKEHNYKTLTMDEFYKWKKGEINLPYKSVLITFDDGFLSNYEYAFPLLKEYGMNATVFVVGSFVEVSENTEWTGNVKTYMSEEILNDVKENYPNIEIYSHSNNLHYQGAIDQSKEVLSEDLKNFNNTISNVDVYCYPFGQYNTNMIEALKENNYKMAFKYGPNKEDYRKASRKDDNFEIPRLNVSHGMNVWKLSIRLLMF